MRSSYFRLPIVILLISIFIIGCGGEDINFPGKSSSKTGEKYAFKEGEEGFRVKEFEGMSTAPGLVFIVGGTFFMGGGEKDIEYSFDNRKRQVSVSSFYMDETEVSNLDYKEFLYYILQDSGEFMYNTLYPDTSIWLRDFTYNDPMHEYYFSHIAFNTYPVVGITWHKANVFCQWRTARVNNKLLEKDPEAILWPRYRLPTESEWEYGARGLLEQENYTWEGKSLRTPYGDFKANFKRGRGDYQGWAGGSSGKLYRHLTDGATYTAPVKAFYPNDFGLYNMAGNVAEWCEDTYRMLSFEDVDDLNPVRRFGKTKVRKDRLLDDTGYQKDISLLHNPDPGRRAGAEEDDNIKVYRGGSWADVAYFLTAGSRRFMHADTSSNTVGFRCVMTRLGSQR